MADEEEASAHHEEAKERSAPTGAVVYAAIREEGESELERRNASLAWSGLAAGMSMGFSFLGEAILRDHLPDAPWRPLLVKLGYSFGFLIVILGRQQLFTENTLTVILPFLARERGATLGNIARLWSIVFAANIAGALLFAIGLARTSAVDPSMRATLAEIARDSISHGFTTTFVRGIFAGWLIALMVWLLPFAEELRVVVIILISYLVGIGSFAHVIAGSVATLYLVVLGDITLMEFLTSFLTPALLGNITGGVLLVAILGHLQFASEHEEK